MGTGGKAKQGRGERFLGRSATFYQDFHIMAGSTKLGENHILPCWEPCTEKVRLPIYHIVKQEAPDLNRGWGPIYIGVPNASTDVEGDLQ